MSGGALRALSDDALAAGAAAGDGEAFGELAARYRGWIGFVTRRHPADLELEDLRQEALIGLWEACRAHDPRRGTFRQMARACTKNRVFRARRDARRRKRLVLSDALGLDAPEARDPTGATIAERHPAPDGVDPARVVQLREDLAELAAALRALSPGYREALARHDEATAKRRCHARRRLERLLKGDPRARAAWSDGRRYSEEQIREALALVAEGKSFSEAGAAVGAANTTVLRWSRRAA